MTTQAVALPCRTRTCKQNLRITFQESEEPSALYDLKCPACSGSVHAMLNADPSGIVVSRLSLDDHGFALADVPTETAPDGVVLFPVLLKRTNGAVSLPIMWPEPLPEVLRVGVSEHVRGYRLSSVGKVVVWYTEDTRLGGHLRP